MNTATQSVGVITPLKALWRWLVATPGQQQISGHAFQPAASGVRCANTLRSQGLRTQPGATSSRAIVSRPLRMVRVMEVGQTSAQVGRMVISGRMEDVCAELDRLVLREATLH